MTREVQADQMTNITLALKAYSSCTSALFPECCNWNFAKHKEKSIIENETIIKQHK